MRVARGAGSITISPAARDRIAAGRARLDEAMARGERIYGVNTGVGGNVKFSLTPEQTALLQQNLVCQLGCATGQPLPGGRGAGRHPAARRHVRDGRFGGAGRAGRGAGGAARSGRHPGGAALWLGGGERRPDALGLHRPRAAGHGRGGIRGPPHARGRSPARGGDGAHGVRSQGGPRAHQRHHRHDRRGGAGVDGCRPRAAGAAGRGGAGGGGPAGARRAVRALGARGEGPPRPDRGGGARSRSCSKAAG